jgi:hypothetical protein
MKNLSNLSNLNTSTTGSTTSAGDSDIELIDDSINIGGPPSVASGFSTILPGESQYTSEEQLTCDVANLNDLAIDISIIV